MTAWQLARGEGGGSGDGQEVWVARLLDQPFGTWLVMAAGLGVIGYGIHQLVKAAKGDVNKRMGASGASTYRGLTLVGRIGTAARGLVLLPIGWFTFRAGRLYSAEETADTGEVLQMLGDGMDARTAARNLGISLNTCRAHIKNVLSKLGAHSQLEAVVTASRAGIIRVKSGAQ